MNPAIVTKGTSGQETHHTSHSQGKTVSSLKNVFDERVKVINFITSQPFSAYFITYSACRSMMIILRKSIYITLSCELN